MKVDVQGNRITVHVGKVHSKDGVLDQADEDRLNNIQTRVDKFAKSIDKGAWAMCQYDTTKRESEASVYFITTKPLKEADITRLKNDTLKGA